MGNVYSQRLEERTPELKYNRCDLEHICLLPHAQAVHCKQQILQFMAVLF